MDIGNPFIFLVVWNPFMAMNTNTFHFLVRNTNTFTPLGEVNMGPCCGVTMGEYGRRSGARTV